MGVNANQFYRFFSKIMIFSNTIPEFSQVLKALITSILI